MHDALASFLKQNGRMIAIAFTAALGILALYLLIETFNAFGKLDDDYNYNSITIEGVGHAEAPPTIAEIVFTVQETADTVAAAQDTANEKVTTALDALHALDIENADIRTSGYAVYPQYETQNCYPGMPCAPESPTVTGYQVSQTVTVKVRNPDQTGPVLEALGTAGVQNISGPNFQVDDDTEVMAEARGEAIEDAHQKARTLAKQLGVRLGDVISFSEGSYGYPSPMYDMAGYGGMEERSMSTPAIPQGVNESEVRVTVTYKIK